MGITEQGKERPLTLKGIRNAVILAIVSCVALAICTSLITVNGFYYNTRNDVDDLKKISSDNTCSIKNLSETVSELSINMEKANTPTSVNSVEIKNLSERTGKLENAIDRLSDKMDKMIEMQSK